MTFAQKVDHYFAEALSAGWVVEDDREQYLQSARATPDHLDAHHSRESLALVAHVLAGAKRPTTAARPAAAAAPSGNDVDTNTPPDLDDDGKALHRQVLDHMRGKPIADLDYFTALAAVAKRPEFAEWSDTPPRKGFDDLIAEHPDVEDYRQQLIDHLLAMVVLRREGVTYMDARELADYDARISELETEAAEQDASDVPWRNTSRLASPPRPWSEEDWERDRRRAEAGGVDDFPRDAWEAAANDGTDLARDLIEAARADELDGLQSRREHTLSVGRTAAAARRRDALHLVLEHRARARLAELQTPRTRHV